MITTLKQTNKLETNKSKYNGWTLTCDLFNEIPTYYSYITTITGVRKSNDTIIKNISVKLIQS